MLIGVAFGIRVRNRRAAAFDIAVIQQHHHRTRRERAMQGFNKTATFATLLMRPPETGECAAVALITRMEGVHIRRFKAHAIASVSGLMSSAVTLLARGAINCVQ